MTESKTYVCGKCYKVAISALHPDEWLDEDCATRSSHRWENTEAVYGCPDESRRRADHLTLDEIEISRIATEALGVERLYEIAKAFETIRAYTQDMEKELNRDIMICTSMAMAGAIHDSLIDMQQSRPPIPSGLADLLGMLGSAGDAPPGLAGLLGLGDAPPDGSPWSN